VKARVESRGAKARVESREVYTRRAREAMYQRYGVYGRGSGYASYNRAIYRTINYLGVRILYYYKGTEVGLVR
jgi:hypothetical protein